MPLRFSLRILDHLAHARYEPAAPRAVAADLRVEEDDLGAFDESVEALIEGGRITRGTDGLLRLPPFGDEVIGVFRQNPRGFGFIVPETPFREGDLFVPPGRARDALSGDRVRAEVIRGERRGRGRGRGDGAVGRIVEVLERGQEHYVGVLQQRGGQWVVLPDGRALRDPVIIRDPHAKNAKAGDKVVIELLHYPEGDYVPEGVITRVLGEAGRPDVETQAVIAAHGLRTEFDQQVLAMARRISRDYDDQAEAGWAEREDLTASFIFTIDPPDAKDFDDAISIEHDPVKDRWTLGVHIADVAHFVRPGAPLDEEARERTTSAYLPRLVIPMLPELISNGVCSLQEGVPRLAKSVFITFDGRGNVVDQRVAATVIRSSKRLTYLEAQELIDGNEEEARLHARTETGYSSELLETLQASDRLARILQKRRRRDGMIVLQLPEVELVFDDDGHVVDAVPEDDAFTHTIIEMFMVEANEAIARLFHGLGIPILRRIHPEPNHHDLDELRMYATLSKQKIPDEPTRQDLQRLLEATRDTPASRAIHFAVLRTFTKATYSPAMIGHFALASEHYAHFTSPIRRYPDLTTHRALEVVLELTDNGRSAPKPAKGEPRRSDAMQKLARRIARDDRTLDEAELIQLGRHCSEAEVEAEQAERELRSFLVLQFLKEHHLGDSFPGVITGITGGGVFVSIVRFLAEGMVRMEDMPQSKGRPDHWKTDEHSGRLRAQRSGAAYGLGDEVTVEILRIDLASRHLDLKMVR